MNLTSQIPEITRRVSVPNGVDEAFALSEYAIQTHYPGEWEPVRSRKRAGQLNKPGWCWPGWKPFWNNNR